MKNDLKKLLVAALVTLSVGAFAAPPDKTGPAKWDDRGGDRAEKGEEFAKRAHMAMVVSLAEALELNEADALKLSEKLKGLEERRRPVREAMHEAMKAVKAAAEGDQAALAQVDANIQKVLDGRAQMAALDKDLFAQLSQGQTPQKKAKLAVALAKMHEFGKMGGGHKGRAAKR